MNKYVTAGLSAVALMAATAPAHALTVLPDVDLTGSDADPGPDFFAPFLFFANPLAAGDYSITYLFDFYSDGYGAANASASLAGGDNTFFDGIFLNGAAGTVSGDAKSAFVNALVVGPPPPANELNLLFHVVTTGKGAFQGSVSAVAVPEPATWGMMILGFGAVGAMLRRRKATTSVSYAM